MAKPNGHWTKERVAAEAAKFETRTGFYKARSGAYQKAYRNGYLDEVCAHMRSVKVMPRKWSKEICAELAAKCTSRAEFNKRYPGARAAAGNAGWMDEVCAHMQQKKGGIHSTHTFAEFKVEAANYTENDGFVKDKPRVVNSTRKNG